MEKSRRKPISRTKTTGVLIKRGEAVDFIQGVGGAQYSKEEHEQIQKRDSITFSVALFVIQLFFLILYAIWLDYPAPVAPGENAHMALYPYFRDVNIMIFFGFGFLMTYLRRYAYSAVGYTFLISAIVVQWSVLIEGYFETVKEDDIRFTTRSITVLELLNGLFCAGAVMISYGAVLGKVTPSQLLIMGFVEPIFYWLNIFITIFLLDVIDVGGGMTIHTFGAYFGLAVTWFLTSPQTRESKDNCSSYNSDIFSLAGTLFLWIMWPSFNAAVAKNDLGQLRAVVNTFLAITSSVMGSFFISRLLSEENKFDVVHIQNSTLAGGVVMGVAADLIVTPYGAIICGFVVSIISVLGYKYVTPFLAKKLNIQDICGVNNLHGMPGISSCLVGVFVTLGATPEKYGSEYGLLFPKGSDQAGYQAAGLFITLGVAIVGGSFTGLLMARGWRIAGIVSSDFYNDRTFWSNPSDYEHVVDKDNEEESEPHDDEFEMKDFEKGEPKQKKVKKSDSSVKFVDENEDKEEKKSMKKDKEDTEEIKEKKEKGKKKEKELKEKKEKKEKREIKNEKKEKDNGKDKKKKKKKESSESESKSSSSSSSSSGSGSEDK